VDPSRIALAGDSAGGNLALSVCTALAQARRALPKALVLAYPATSNAHAGPSWDAFEHAPVLCKADALWFWSNYVAGSGADLDPRAVPILSTTLHALPPTLLVSAEVDVLRSDYEHFAATASRAGAEVEIRRYDGVPHGFFTELASIAQAGRAVADAAHHLRTHFGD
jgi:acetyl esterase